MVGAMECPICSARMIRWCAGWRCPSCTHVEEVRPAKWTVPHYAVAIGLVMGLAASCTGLAGCSASALAVQARIADTVARAANAARPLVLTEYRAAQVAVLDRDCPSAQQCAPEAARAGVAEVRRLWSPVWVAADSARAVHDLWAEAIRQCAEQANRATCTPQVQAMALRFVERVQEWRCALRAVGRTDLDALPLPPPQCSGGAR